LKHDDVVRPVGSCRIGCAGAPGLVGQSGLDDEDADAVASDDADEAPDEDDDAFGTTWALAAAATTTVAAANGIR